MEKDLQKSCIEYARSIGLMIYSINPPDFKRMTFGTLFNLPDTHIVDFNAYFELKDRKYKSNHKERQEKQEKRRNELIEHNAKAFKVTTLEEFKQIIESLKRDCKIGGS